ncbi:MAG: DUF2934 domain-containing protein [Steroidobacteraceae bacterium]
MHYPRESELMEFMAYHLWEREGRPAGRAEDHWREAERLLEIEFRLGYPDPTGAGGAAKPPADQ